MDRKLDQKMRDAVAHKGSKGITGLGTLLENFDVEGSEVFSEAQQREILEEYLKIRHDGSVFKKVKLSIISAIESDDDLSDYPKVRQKTKIISPPGFGLLRLSHFLYSRKTFEEVFQPVISDMQVEHLEAVANGDLLKAKWIVLRGRVAFWSAVISFLPVSLGRRCSEIWKAIGSGG